MNGSPVVEGSAGRARRPGPVLWLALGLLACWLVDGVHSRLPPERDSSLEAAFVPDPALASLFSLGMGSVMADFYWLQAIQAVGGAARATPELGSHVGKLIDVVTTLDPWVDHPYRFAAVWMTESESNVRMANRLLERGIEHHPEDWRNHFYLGFNHFFYLLENSRAAEILERASTLPGAPRYLPRLVARLRSESADIEVAEVFLQELLSSSEDEVAKESYRAALDEIEVEHRARLLDIARLRFEEASGGKMTDVAELVSGDHAPLGGLPSAEPSSLPPSLGRGSVWRLDAASGRIVSSYYGKRYQLHLGASDRARAEGFAQERTRREERVSGREGNGADGR